MTDLRDPNSPPKRSTPIQLGWSQFATLLASFFSTLGLILLLLWPPYEWVELYYRELVVRQLQTRYGFRLGEVRGFRNGRLYAQRKGVVEVSPGGELSRIGVRAGDAPFGFYRTGFIAMYDALDTAERGGFAALQVVNVHDLGAGENGARTIPVHPRVRELPRSFLHQKSLPSPAGNFVALVAESALDRTVAELWLWDHAADIRTRLLAFHDWGLGRASVTWSADGKWLAVEDQSLGSPWRCVLIEATRAESLNVTDSLMLLAPDARPESSERLDCEIFGWVRDNPTRVAVIFHDFAARGGEPSIFYFYFDVTARRLVAAARR